MCTNTANLPFKLACLLACFSSINVVPLLRIEGSFSPNLDSCIVTHLGLNAESRRETIGIDPLVVYLIHFFKVLWRYVGNVDCNGNKVLPLQTCCAQYSIQLLERFFRLLSCAGRHLGKISAKPLRPEHPSIDYVFRHSPCLDARRSDRWWKLAWCRWCLCRCYFGDEGAEECAADECRSSSGRCILAAAHGCSNFTYLCTYFARILLLPYLFWIWGGQTDGLTYGRPGSKSCSPESGVRSMCSHWSEVAEVPITVDTGRPSASDKRPRGYQIHIAPVACLHSWTSLSYSADRVLSFVLFCESRRAAKKFCWQKRKRQQNY